MSDKLFKRDFDSLSDLMDFLQTPRVWWIKKSNKAGGGEGDGWSETVDYAQAQELARFGWPKGRDQMDQSVRNAVHSITYQAAPTRTLDVCGAYPIVPLACAGDPMNMITIGEDKRAQRPIARFLVSLSISGSVSPSVIQTRGAAILSWIDALEAEGIRCEVAIHLGSKLPNGIVESQTIIKRAEDPLDIDRMAYALVHPSMLRRHLFALMERSPRSFENSGYGLPHEAKPEDDQIYFGRLLSNGCDTWGSIETALAHVRAQIERGGIFMPPDDELQDAA